MMPTHPSAPSHELNVAPGARLSTTAYWAPGPERTATRAPLRRTPASEHGSMPSSGLSTWTAIPIGLDAEVFIAGLAVATGESGPRCAGGSPHATRMNTLT